ncbi:MAG TPA: prolyl oligopeptidase family serine peptidase, partial [Bacteroidales bacterium]|nr:prolyl oligopeptidase family serine peptidase [Bacteroidales bacterium]
NQVTRGEWMVTSFEGFDPKGRMVYFMSTAAGPLEEQLYAADLKKGRLQRLTYAPGTHSVVFREDKAYFFDVYSSTTVAREYLLLNNSGSLVEMMLENKDPLEGYALGEMKLFTLKADDGSDLHCRMILPPGFDATRKYPALVYVYGGPHAQLVTNSWLGGAGLFLNYMAQEGFVVFTLDNRGSAHRGKAFEQALFRNCGSVEVADQLKGVEYLKSLPYVDAGRIGVNGWSYGGFMTISMMLKHPGLFKVACAGGPVIDWKWYEVMYGERYMDTPQDNPEGYKASSLLNYVDQLEGKLLVIHGTMDPVVVWQHSLEFLKKCVDEGKQVDYFVYPGHEHNVGGKDRMHLNQKIAEYFKENL